MDPDATMRLLLVALAALKTGRDPHDTRAEAVMHLRDLADWLARGGFPPRSTYVEQGGAP